VSESSEISMVVEKGLELVDRSDLGSVGYDGVRVCCNCFCNVIIVLPEQEGVFEGCLACVVERELTLGGYWDRLVVNPFYCFEEAFFISCFGTEGYEFSSEDTVVSRWR